MVENFSLPEMSKAEYSKFQLIETEIYRNHCPLPEQTRTLVASKGERETRQTGRETQIYIEREVWERGSIGSVFQKSPEPFITANLQTNTKGAFILVLTYLQPLSPRQPSSSTFQLQYIPYTHSPPCLTSTPSIGAPSIGMSKINVFLSILRGLKNPAKLLK